MAKKPSPSKRIVEAERRIISRIEEMSKRLPDGYRKKLLACCRNAKRKGMRGPCDTEQAAYNALVTSAAQKQIDADDAQAVANQKQSDANIEFMLAMAAYVVLQACLNP
jgi:hypothetical protein